VTPSFFHEKRYDAGLCELPLAAITPERAHNKTDKLAQYFGARLSSQISPSPPNKKRNSDTKGLRFL